MEKKNIIGQTFGEWTVLREATLIDPGFSDGVSAWLCRCSCGIIRVMRTGALTSGRSLSCGAKLHSLPPELRVSALRQPPDAHGCPYIKDWLVCSRTDCAGCGWNPAEDARRRKRLRERYK